MALVNHKPTHPARVAPLPQIVTAHPKEHEIYDHKTTPLWSLDSFLTGSKWTVTYFRQRLGAGDPPKKLDVSMDPAHQSYDMIASYDMLVQSPLSSSSRDKEQIMEVTGSSLFYSFSAPSVDDYFIAESNLARLGLFRITNVNRRNHERESVYLVEYTEEAELTVDHDLYKDIHRKIVNRYTFSRQRLVENKNPILLTETYTRLENMYHEFKDLARCYFRDFFNLHSMSLQLPGQRSRVVDPWVPNFLSMIVPMEDIPNGARARVMTTNNDPSYDRPVLWNILIQRRVNELKYAERKMGVYQPYLLYSTFFGRSGNFASADYILYPDIQDKSLDSGATFNPGSSCSCTCNDKTTSFDYEFAVPTSISGLGYLEEAVMFKDMVPALPGFKPVVLKDGYVFGEKFYNGEPESILEVMVLDYLRHQAINLYQLKFVLDLYSKMGRLDQFYYGPLLLLLLKEADRGAYA